MRNNLIRGVAFVDRRLENLHALPRNFRAAQPPDQLLAFSRKHGADHNFDPAHIALDDVHRLLLTKFPSPLLAPNGPSLIIAQPRPRGTSSRYKKGQRRRPQLPEMPPSG